MIFVAQNAIQLQQQQSQKCLSAIKNYARIVKIIESKIAYNEHIISFVRIPV